MLFNAFSALRLLVKQLFTGQCIICTRSNWLFTCKDNTNALVVFKAVFKGTLYQRTSFIADTFHHKSKSWVWLQFVPCDRYTGKSTLYHLFIHTQCTNLIECKCLVFSFSTKIFTLVLDQM